MLNTIRHGVAGGGVPLVIAHGLFGSARNWGVIARRLSDRREVIAVDMRNHGDSPRSDVQDYPAMAQDLAEVIADAGGRADVLGHSMGGKAAMVLALSRPALVQRLVVADIAPVTYGHTQLPLIAAMQALDLAKVARRSDADAMLAARVTEPGVRAFLVQSLDIGPQGARWKLNLDALAAAMPAIMGFPDGKWRFDGPTLFVSGASSDYVRAEHHDAIRGLFPAARFETIDGAGHWLHAEAPRRFEEVVRAFLDA